MMVARSDESLGMTPLSYRSALTRVLAATAATMTMLLAAPAGTAAATPTHLPLGDSDLTETRSTRTLTRGVTLTRIVRGTEPAPADQINTTPRGPWVVNVLTIDPRRTHGHLEATYGPDLAGTEPTTELVRSSGALAGVNASFFTFTASAQYPGDPVGLGIYGGKLLSEPVDDPTEADFVLDARGNRAVMGKLNWSGSVRNRRTGAELRLGHVNHPPEVPASCTGLADQGRCAEPGEVSRFTPEFAVSTPSGPGTEVVFDRRGCAVRTSTERGTRLAAGQTSVQATGAQAATLLTVAGTGCVRTSSALTDERGRQVPLRKGLFGVTGRYRLVRDGQIVVPAGTGSFFDRNPRTIAGTTRDGKIVLATLDGRMTGSVGTTMDETAAVAEALGMSDAVNLDGGGSTAMSVGGRLVNQPSGTSERAVGDALVFVDRPYRP